MAPIWIDEINKSTFEAYCHCYQIYVVIIVQILPEMYYVKGLIKLVFKDHFSNRNDHMELKAREYELKAVE